MKPYTHNWNILKIVNWLKSKQTSYRNEKDIKNDIFRLAIEDCVFKSKQSSRALYTRKQKLNETVTKKTQQSKGNIDS